MSRYEFVVVTRSSTGRPIAKRWGVKRYDDGVLYGWALPPQDDEQRARNLADTANAVARMTAPKENHGGS